jgi:hypothetical protein
MRNGSMCPQIFPQQILSNKIKLAKKHKQWSLIALPSLLITPLAFESDIQPWYL